MKLSVCIIAHNEEAKLARTLESVHFADEIIIIDCASDDRTAEIASSFSVKLHQRPNHENLNINKNYAFDQAQGEFILCIDADEVVPDRLAREILSTIEKAPRANGFFLPRRNHYFGHWLRYGGHYPDWQLRLFRRGKGRFPEKHVHERIRIDGDIAKLKSPLDHFPYESREEAERKLDFYTSYEAQHLLNRGVRPCPVNALKFLIWKPVIRLLRRYIVKLGFLDGAVGWTAISMDMRNFRMRYRKLQQLANSPETSP